jgi:hypothetical protein
MQSKRPPDDPANDRAVVVSSMYSNAEIGAQIGREAYSYRFVYKAFAPLLERWGRTRDVDRPESRLDHALMQARQQGLNPVHLSFLPLDRTYLTSQAPNIVFPFWEFPDVPDRAFAYNLRTNWVNVAKHVSLILTACNFTRDAFVRAGVRTPIRVVPVPTAQAYFAVPAWQPEQSVVLDCPAYIFPQPDRPAPTPPSVWEPQPQPRGMTAWAKRLYNSYIKPRIPSRINRSIMTAARALKAASRAQDNVECVPYALSEKLELSGVVFTTILNPFDLRKNWQDLLSAFLLSLGDCADATLVFKLVVCDQLAAAAINAMLHYYRRLGTNHRAKVILVRDYLSDDQMVQLARASTYYCNASRAEGSCMPLQNFMAAGRPGITANHTAITDYFSADLGFVVESHPEPASWPHDPEEKLCTRWHRLIWQSLGDQLRHAYETAHAGACFEALATRSRERMADYASAERVWPQLAAALDFGRSDPGAAALQAGAAAPPGVVSAA